MKRIIKNKIASYRHCNRIGSYPSCVTDFEKYLEYDKNKKNQNMIRNLILVGCDDRLAATNMNYVYPNLFYLRITVSSITCLPKISLYIKKLSLDHCNIEEIHSLFFLEELDCHYCVELKKVFDVPAIRSVHVVGSPFVVFDELVTMPFLKTLMIDNHNYFTE